MHEEYVYIILVLVEHQGQYYDSDPPKSMCHILQSAQGYQLFHHHLAAMVYLHQLVVKNMSAVLCPKHKI